MAARVDSKDSSGSGSGSVDQSRGGVEDKRTNEEKLQDLAKDIEKLKWKLTEKDKDADRVRASVLQKSKSLEDGANQDYQVTGRVTKCFLFMVLCGNN